MRSRREERWHGEGLGNKGKRKGGRSEGNAAGTVYTCHLLLLRAKNTQEEQEMRRSRRRRRGRGRGGAGGSSITKQACALF